MVKNGLSVYEHNALKDFIKENVKFVKDEDIDLCLNILDGLKSGRISSEIENSSLLSGHQNIRGYPFPQAGYPQFPLRVSKESRSRYQSVYLCIFHVRYLPFPVPCR